MEKKCLLCGIKFRTPNVRRKYCSEYCYHKHRDQKGEKNPCWKDIISKEELTDLYLNKKYSLEKIAKMKGTGWEEIKRRVIMLGIKPRSFNESCRLGREQSEDYKRVVKRNPNSKKGNRKIYLEIAKANFPWVCSSCGALRGKSGMDLVVHHRDMNNRNNSLNNLQILCQGCHINTHKLGGWNAKNKDR